MDTTAERKRDSNRERKNMERRGESEFLDLLETSPNIAVRNVDERRKDKKYFSLCRSWKCFDTLWFIQNVTKM